MTPPPTLSPQSREAYRNTAHWLERNIAINDATFKAAYFALLTLLIADRPDNRHDVVQRMHRKTLREFYEKLSA